MPNYSLTTHWKIPAPIESVWLALLDTEQWPTWWKYVKEVKEIRPGDSSGLNSIRRYFWKTRLPYQLILDLEVTQLSPYASISVKVKGDLDGQGFCKLYNNLKFTSIVFLWNVKTCKHWMNQFPILSQPIFIWNHQQVMKHGEKSLIQRLSYD